LSDELPHRLSVSDIAALAGVGPAAVSNWARRHEDFPRPFEPIEGEDARKVYYPRDGVLAFLALRGITPLLAGDATQTDPSEAIRNFERLLRAAHTATADDSLAAAAVHAASAYFERSVQPHASANEVVLSPRDRRDCEQFLDAWRDDLRAAELPTGDPQRLSRRIEREDTITWVDVVDALSRPLEQLARQRRRRSRAHLEAPIEGDGEHTIAAAAAYFTLARAARCEAPAVRHALAAYEAAATDRNVELASHLLVRLADEIAHEEGLTRDLLWTSKDEDAGFTPPRTGIDARAEFRRAVNFMSTPRGPWGRDSIATDMRTRELFVAVRMADGGGVIDPAVGAGGVIERCVRHGFRPHGWELNPSLARVASQRLLLLRELAHEVHAPVKCRDALSYVRTAYRKVEAQGETVSPERLAAALSRELIGSRASLVVLDPPAGLARSGRRAYETGTASDWLQLASALTDDDGAAAILLTRPDLEAATRGDDLAVIPMLVAQGRVEAVLEIPPRERAAQIVRVLLVLRGEARAKRGRTDTIFGRLDQLSTGSVSDGSATPGTGDARLLHELLMRFRQGADVETIQFGFPIAVATGDEIASREHDLIPRLWLDRAVRVTREDAQGHITQELANLRSRMSGLSQKFASIKPSPTTHVGASPLDELIALTELTRGRMAPFEIIPNVPSLLTRERDKSDGVPVAIATVDGTGENRTPTFLPTTFDTTPYEVLGRDVLVTPRPPAGTYIRIHPASSDRAITTRPTLCLRITEIGAEAGWNSEILALVLEYATRDIEARSAINPTRVRIPASPQGLSAAGLIVNQLREIEADFATTLPQIHALREYLAQATISGSIDLAIDE
jgi:hypothetical protein